MATILLSSYSETNQNGEYKLDGNTLQYVGQSVSSAYTATSTLDSIKFYLKKIGSPTGTLTVTVWDFLLIGQVAESDAVSASSVSTSFDLVNFEFSGANRLSLGSSTYYYVVKYTDGDTSNYISIGVDKSGTSPVGIAVYSADASTWNPLNSEDCPFYLYGDVNEYTLTYNAGAGGSISGTSPQTVAAGGDGTAVTAVPNTGYSFTAWSDSDTSNPRTDTNVQSDITVTALFKDTTPPDWPDLPGGGGGGGGGGGSQLAAEGYHYKNVVTWSSISASDFDHYSLYRSEQYNTGYQRIVSNTLEQEYIDTDVTVGTTYWYKAKAHDTSGNTTWSNYDDATPLGVGGPSPTGTESFLSVHETYHLYSVGRPNKSKEPFNRGAVGKG